MKRQISVSVASGELTIQERFVTWAPGASFLYSDWTIVYKGGWNSDLVESYLRQESFSISK